MHEYHDSVHMQLGYAVTFIVRHCHGIAALNDVKSHW